jgi:hypothetical protein
MADRCGCRGRRSDHGEQRHRADRGRHPPPPLVEVRAAAQRLPELEGAASDAFEAREFAARALDTASIERNDVLGDVLEREGRPRHTPRSAPPRESVYVPTAGRWI